MEDKKMKLIGLNVTRLYGCFDYSVTFNADVTFIYGMNGCGKTTILNITEAIITGQLFKLFDYEFSKIQLLYAKNRDIKKTKKIEIKFFKQSIIVNFNSCEKEIKKLINSDDSRSLERSARDVFRLYFEEYPILLKIKETFNYVYLPLNRSMIPYENDENYYYLKRYRIRMDPEFIFDMNANDIAMLQIESLIDYHHSKINSTINKISDEFRNNILKSLLEFNQTYDLHTIIREMDLQNNTISNLQKIRTDYIKMLKELELLSLTEEEKFNQFFDMFIGEFIKYQQESGSISPIELMLKFQEISKIKKSLNIAEKMEQRKALVRRPIETFLTTMNDFIGNSEDSKKINIDSMGRIFFTTKYNRNPIRIQHLSSGEKQLITFFANLIFNVKSNSSGIFVVDEPELSLHLSWQKIFIEKTLGINKNIQLIFATHAPEIIGNRRNKMYKLEKKYTKVEE